MNLHLKAVVYRYTGIYLAAAEEAAYIRSREHIQYVESLLQHPENDLYFENAEDISIGMWQGEYGFYRPMSFLRYRRPGFIFKPLAWVQDFYTVLKMDYRYWRAK